MISHIHMTADVPVLEEPPAVLNCYVIE